ncbi:MAG: hypothetical protein QOI62_1574 [Solirubrobacteraceae bacterium]|jgi:hypothetical protein|nr:hypothetical protein [Solirubrobacteraceae bacterium]MEA2358314.1 hypothetical protein [Solirubrobacteraceae bacterium]MEA2394960.1 hypothetical protein [Solirubrobacteraceae bacterium]
MAALLLADAGMTALTIVLAAAIVIGWIVVVVIYLMFFRGRGS